MGPTARFDGVEKREICELSVNRNPCRPPGSLVSKRTAIIACPVRTFRAVFHTISVPQIEQNDNSGNNKLCSKKCTSCAHSAQRSLLVHSYLHF
jgi:hypothetical protein